MIEFTGKYGTAVVMLETLSDAATIKQINEFLNDPSFTGKIVIMPDTHYGKGAVIGFTMPLGDTIIPSVVGVDVSCGMLMMLLNSVDLGSRANRLEIDAAIRKLVPVGAGKALKKPAMNMERHFPWTILSESFRSFVMAYNKKFNTSFPTVTYDFKWFLDACDRVGVDPWREQCNLGTLGGGNHFIELGYVEETSQTSITVHSGSRNIGAKMAMYWTRRAVRRMNEEKECLADAAIKKVLESTPPKQRESFLRKIRSQREERTHRMPYLEGEDAMGYYTDMVFCNTYASVSRSIMMENVRTAIGTPTQQVASLIETVHNFIDFDDMIIRKGAVPAYSGRQLIIPFNMEDGILLCEGRSNPDWNYSAPHGAGRVDSRRWAKDNLDLEAHRKSMDELDIVASVLPKDELKGAYKSAEMIEDNIGPTADIILRARPKLVIKGK